MSSTPTSPSASSKLLGLELIRFACAIVVLIWHYRHFASIGAGDGTMAEPMPFEALLYPIYRFGAYGVQIFWCISGFIFYWKYAEPLAAGRVASRNFFWLRFSRLYPLHFVTLVMVAGLQPVYEGLAGHSFIYSNNDTTSFVLQLVLGDQWFQSRPLSFNGPVWSVSSEVFVYLAFFLLLRAFGRTPWIIIAAIGAGLASLWSGHISPPVVCAAYFFAGGAAAEVMSSAIYQRNRSGVRCAAVLVVIFCLLAISAVDLTQSEDLLATWFLIVTPACLLLAAQDFAPLARFQRPIQAAGNLTYSTYLIHFPMQLAVAVIALKAGITVPVAAAWFFLAYLVAAIVVGRVIFTRFEAPVQDWIRAATLSRRTERALA